MPYATMYTDNKAIVLAVVLVLILAGAAWYMGWIKPGAVVQTGTAYVDLTMQFSDYFYTASGEEDLPSSVTIYVFDQKDETSVVRDIDLTQYKSISVEGLAVELPYPKIFVRVDAPSVETTVNGVPVLKAWYVIYPSEVRTEQPTTKGGYTVYPVDLSGLGISAGERVSYTLSIALAKTFNITNLELPTEINTSVGTAPTHLSFSGTVSAPENYTMYRDVYVKIVVPNTNVSVESVVFDGRSLTVSKVSDTEYRATVGTVVFYTEGKQLDVGLEVKALGSYTITISIIGKMPDGTEVTLASKSVTINVS